MGLFEQGIATTKDTRHRKPHCPIYSGGGGGKEEFWPECGAVRRLGIVD